MINQSEHPHPEDQVSRNWQQNWQRTPQLDENGLLQYPEQWNPRLATHLANQLDITALNDDHWAVINDMREHYQRFAVAPNIHSICHKHQKNEFWVHQLFGNCLNAWRVAGLPDPGEEARAYLNDM